jgi:hypothetical protein
LFDYLLLLLPLLSLLPKRLERLECLQGLFEHKLWNIPYQRSLLNSFEPAELL